MDTLVRPPAVVPGAEEFKNAVLQQFFIDMHKIEQDNYPWERLNNDPGDRSQTFDIGKHLTNLNWFFNNHASLYQAYRGLANEESRALLIDVIRYRLAGHLHARLDGKWKNRAAIAHRFRETFVGTPSQFAAPGKFGDFFHYDAVWDGTRYEVDTFKDALIWYLVYRQYFYEVGPTRIQPEPGDYLIDGGAFTGDATVVFANAVGAQGRVYAFDPIQNHLDLIDANIKSTGLSNVTTFAYGLSDRTVERPAVRLDSFNPGFRIAADSVPVCRIDDLVMDGRIQRVDFIKMDIEGSEMAALRGAMATIAHFRPKLAISVYHNPNDLFEIQNTLQDQLKNFGYRFYLDHYTYWDAETVLYGIVDK